MNSIRISIFGVRANSRSQAGLGLVETLVAVAILGTCVTAFVSGLSAGTLAVNEQDRLSVSQGLAQSQFEYTKNYPFDSGAAAYPLIPAPEGYEIEVSVTPVPGADVYLQKINISVSLDGAQIMNLEGYKQDR